jgi:hypothetical protein
MRCLLLSCLGLGVALVAASTCLGHQVEFRRETSDVRRLVRQLGSDRFEEREAASKALAAIGLPAFGALRDALGDEDAEIRRRAELLLDRLRPRMLNRARSAIERFTASLQSPE